MSAEISEMGRALVERAMLESVLSVDPYTGTSHQKGRDEAEERLVAYVALLEAVAEAARQVDKSAGTYGDLDVDEPSEGLVDTEALRANRRALAALDAEGCGGGDDEACNQRRRAGRGT